jgi:hypothetical protein
MPTANIVDVELQAISGGLQLAKRTLDDVLARVTVNPGPTQDPVALTALTSIIATSQLIMQEAQQIQTIMNPTGGGTPGA